MNTLSTISIILCFMSMIDFIIIVILLSNTTKLLNQISKMINKLVKHFIVKESVPLIQTKKYYYHDCHTKKNFFVVSKIIVILLGLVGSSFCLLLLSFILFVLYKFIMTLETRQFDENIATVIINAIFTFVNLIKLSLYITLIIKVICQKEKSNRLEYLWRKDYSTFFP
ncbi:hypothetical protein Catovirus_1_673 [Catovirus CTV1]|uniref:Uncharacterized protein n=1 Tax=Catovirus CTV1 TaxID=1977631 RepID=A0A1V0SAA4_9VIRU|nr:hypothetical protein Catovirus_1_673 [Catovirus CTV1]